MRLLTTLGGLALTDSSGSPAVTDGTQRRLILLALAAEAGSRGLPRDRAIALLWPDADEERGRRSLNQLRYTLRRDLGADPLVGTLTLRPDPAELTSDLEHLRTAVAAGETDIASRLFTGAFLDGVPLGGSAELDEWAEGCRVEIRRAVERLLERSARAAHERGAFREAEEVWRRLLSLDALRAPYTVGLMECLAAAGDTTGALVVAAEHQGAVRRELDVPPDPSVAAAVARIRQQPPATVMPGCPPAPATPPALAAAPARPALPPGLPPQRIRRWRSAVVVFSGTAALVAGAIAVGSSRVPPANTTVAVFPFTVRGDSAYRYLGEGMVTLLSAKLDGAGVLRPVDGRAVLSAAKHQARSSDDPRAAALVADRLGAGLYFLGDILEVDGRLRLEVTGYRVGRGEAIATAGVEGVPGDIFRLVDSLASALLAELGAGDIKFSRLAAATTGSLEHLKAYLEGQQLFRDGHFLQANDAFRRAAADTTFALANYWLSVSGWWADQSDVIEEAADRAVRHGARLAQRDRLLLHAWDTLLHGDAVEAERLYRAVLGVEPENIHASTQLGEVLFHYGPRRGSPPAAAGPLFARVLEFEPGDPGSLLHLARIAGMEGRFADLDAFVHRILTVDSLGEWAFEARTLRAFAFKDSIAEEKALAHLRQSGDGQIWSEALYVRLSARNPEGSRRLIALLTDPARAPEVRAFGHVALAYADLAEGKASGAWMALDRAAGLDSVSALEHRALLLSLPFLPPDTASLLRARDDLRRWHPTPVARLGASHVGGVHDDAHLALRAYLLGTVSARLGDSAETARAANDLLHLPGAADLRAYAREAAASLHAQTALASGRTSEGVAILSTSLRTETRISRMGASPFYARALERYLLAEGLRRLGREAEADRWYATFTCQPVFDLIFLAPSHLRQAEMAALAGRRTTDHDTAALALWANADPILQPQLAAARRRGAS